MLTCILSLLLIWPQKGIYRYMISFIHCRHDGVRNGQSSCTPTSEKSRLQKQWTSQEQLSPGHITVGFFPVLFNIDSEILNIRKAICF